MSNTNDICRITPHAVAYRALALALADRVGRHHLPLRDDASDINELLLPDAVHYELSKDMLRMIYRRNRCGHLDARVQPGPTFAALGEIRWRLTRCRTTDIDQVNLLEEVGWALREIFQTDLSTAGAPVATVPEIVAFPQRRAV